MVFCLQRISTCREFYLHCTYSNCGKKFNDISPVIFLVNDELFKQPFFSSHRHRTLSLSTSHLWLKMCHFPWTPFSFLCLSMNPKTCNYFIWSLQVLLKIFSMIFFDVEIKYMFEFKTLAIRLFLSSLPWLLFNCPTLL